MKRDELLSRLEKLLPAQFEEVLFHLRIPSALLSGVSGPQSIRAIEVLRHLENTGELAMLEPFLLSYDGGAGVSRVSAQPPAVAKPVQVYADTGVEALSKRLEMGGGLIVKSDTSANDWVRAGSRSYIIIGFIVVCATIAVTSVLAITTRSEPEPTAAVGQIQLRASSLLPETSPLSQPASEAEDRIAGPAAHVETSPSGARGDTRQRTGTRPVEGSPWTPSVQQAVVAYTPILRGTDAAVPASSELYTINYRSARHEDRLQISYTLPYLEKIQRGDLITGVPFKLTSQFGWRFPELSFKIVNNTESTISINEIRIEVKHSTLNDEVIPVIYSGTIMNLTVRNEGWADVVDPVWQLVAAPIKSCTSASPGLDNAITIRRPTFSKSDLFPIWSVLGSALRSADEVCVFGQLQYGESGRRHSLRFSTVVFMKMISQEPMPASATYKVVLHAGQLDTYIVPVDQKLPPGETDHVVLVVAADRSASFDLEISMSSIGSPVAMKGSTTIDVLVPRTVGEALATPRP